jgi:hypothetical protein
MEEARRATAQEQPKKSQIRRAQRGIVAGYIHELSERHVAAFSHLPSGPARTVKRAVTVPPVEECLPATAARPGRTGSRALRAEPGDPARS